MNKSIWTENSSFLLDRFKTCFDTAKSKISTNAAIPAKNYGFTKQKHIRGDKTLKIYNFGPKVTYLEGLVHFTGGTGGGPRDHLNPKVEGRRGEPDTLSQPVDPGGVGGFIFSSLRYVSF